MNSTTLPSQSAVDGPSLTVLDRSTGNIVSEMLISEPISIGSGEDCDLRLRGEAVARLHCWFDLSGRQLVLKDCFSDSGTLLNGRRVNGDVVLSGAAQIDIGDFRIVVNADDEHPGRLEAPSSTADSDTSDSLNNVLLQRIGELERELKAALAELTKSQHEQKRLKQQVSQLAILAQSNAPLNETDPILQETIDLLRTEVELLQQELSDREARLAPVYGSADNCHNEPIVAADSLPDETARLVERLEMLLDELQQADEQTARLEQLLRAADDANQAEQEEREQLEAWVSEIENRMEQQEAERNAELGILRKQIDQAVAGQQQAERRLAGLLAANRTDDSLEAMIEELQGQVRSLQQSLAEAESQQKQLEQELKTKALANKRSVADANSNELPADERAQIAHEYVEIARQKVELAEMRSQLQDRRAESNESPQDIDHRIRGFRQHLKELHEQEQKQRREKSLSARISRVWQRLEGRSA